jgi:hypothetical protein
MLGPPDPQQGPPHTHTLHYPEPELDDDGNPVEAYEPPPPTFTVTRDQGADPARWLDHLSSCPERWGAVSHGGRWWQEYLCAGGVKAYRRAAEAGAGERPSPPPFPASTST